MRVLITGITGSLGKRLVPHYLNKGHQIRGLSRCEDKQSRLIQKYPGLDLELGDIRSKNDCLRATRNCDLIVHTAALKRIEMGEKFPFQFIQTNLLGTINMVESAWYNRVPKMVFVSTDKAVEPINVYGMTKALSEKIVTNSGFNCVRYGNVNNSRGSVIPLWKKLSAEGKKLPITNKEMTRFMISMRKAISLIDLASTNMSGSIYIPKLYSSKVIDIARLFDTRKDFFQLVGERPGEKLHEVLINQDEFRNRVEEHSDYFIVRKQSTEKTVKKKGEYSSSNAKHLKGSELKKYLGEYL